MEIIRIINKEGIKAQGGLDIPSPFIFKANTTGLDFNKKSVGFRGEIFKDTSSESAIILDKGLSQDRTGRLSTNLGGIANECATYSSDGLTITLDENKIIQSIDDLLIDRLGITQEDIS